MTCQKCGRDDGHWLGCSRAAFTQGPKADLVVVDELSAVTCEHEGCSNPKKEWSGRGARPKYCAEGHK